MAVKGVERRGEKRGVFRIKSSKMGSHEDHSLIDIPGNRVHTQLGRMRVHAVGPSEGGRASESAWG